MQLPARILVIEDNLANMELMAYLLKAYGYDPLCAHDGRQGIELASSNPPDLVICDVHLPHVDGYGVVSFLKGHAGLRTIPVIAVTALAMVGDQEKLLEAGFDGYISKPIDPERFVPAIEQFLQRGRAGEQDGTPPSLSGEE
ncbi:MAG TPA: response regulator [Noviherbaspirillum sp.]